MTHKVCNFCFAYKNSSSFASNRLEFRLVIRGKTFSSAFQEGPVPMLPTGNPLPFFLPSAALRAVSPRCNSTMQSQKRLPIHHALRKLNGTLLRVPNSLQLSSGNENFPIKFRGSSNPWTRSWYEFKIDTSLRGLIFNGGRHRVNFELGKRRRAAR